MAANACGCQLSFPESSLCSPAHACALLVATCKSSFNKLEWSVFCFPRQLCCLLALVKSWDPLLPVLPVVKSGNFSGAEKEVNVLSSCVLALKSTRVKLRGKHAPISAGSGSLFRAHRCKIPGFSKVRISSSGILRASGSPNACLSFGEGWLWSKCHLAQLAGG